MIVLNEQALFPAFMFVNEGLILPHESKSRICNYKCGDNGIPVYLRQKKIINYKLNYFVYCLD